jgi:hypothetical protein
MRRHFAILSVVPSVAVASAPAAAQTRHNLRRYLSTPNAADLAALAELLAWGMASWPTLRADSRTACS